jgi:transcriptional regulator
VRRLETEHRNLIVGAIYDAVRTSLKKKITLKMLEELTGEVQTEVSNAREFLEIKVKQVAAKNAARMVKAIFRNPELKRAKYYFKKWS